jgi:hypothetical protein
MMACTHGGQALPDGRMSFPRAGRWPAAGHDRHRYHRYHRRPVRLGRAVKFPSHVPAPVQVTVVIRQLTSS